MAITIAVANQKGGVGKTTTALNLAAALNIKRQKTLLVDLDPQGNASSGYGIRKKGMTDTSYELILGKDIKSVIKQTPFGDIIPANINLAAAEIELVGLENREFYLKNALKSVQDDYKYIIIDCPPSLSMLTINALCAADKLLIPMQCEYFALEGLSELTATVRTIRKALNPELLLEGVVLTMFDGRNNLTMQVVEELKKFFGDKVYKTPISKNVRLAEAPSFGKPVMYYDKYSKGAECYTRLCEEFLARN